MRRNLFSLACLAGLIVPAVAGAQPAAPPTPPATPPASPPEVIAPGPGTPGMGNGRTASSAINGVVRPPNVDQGIAVAPPLNAPQTMPVIPPPGTPGTNSPVVPK
jgi:hypothetical protein